MHQNKANFENKWRNCPLNSFDERNRRQSERVQTYVDLMVMQRSCSSFLVSVKRASPAFDAAMIPALETKESVRVDLP